MKGHKILSFVVAVFAIILLIYFVLAVAAPTSVHFEQNTTNNYDKEGYLHLNWTNVSSNATITIVGHNLYVNFTNGTIFQTRINASNYTFNITANSNYTFIVESFANDSTKANASMLWMIVDTVVPAISYNPNTETDSSFANKNFIFVNVSASDINNVSSNLTFSLYNSSAILIRQNVTNYSSITSNNSFNWTGLAVGSYFFNVTANDSATNSNSTSTRTLAFDTTNPIVSISQSAVSTSTIDIIISRSDASSGINSCTSNRGTISGTALSDTSLSCGATYSYIVTCTDNAGNSASDTESFATNGCGSSNTNVSTTASSERVNSWSKITPGAATIMKDFSSEFGLKQIQIEVNNEAQNVKIAVTKYDSKPAEVPVSKSGRIYQYLQIKTENLLDKLDKANAEFKVAKLWASQNNLSREKIAISKFNETSKQWMELPTISSGEDSNYYYYDVELRSFSYFAISEKSLTNDTATTTGTGTQSTTPEKGANLTTYLLVLVVALVAAYFGWQIVKKRRR